MNKEKEFREKTRNNKENATDVFRTTHTCWNVWQKTTVRRKF